MEGAAGAAQYYCRSSCCLEYLSTGIQYLMLISSFIHLLLLTRGGAYCSGHQAGVHHGQVTHLHHCHHHHYHWLCEWIKQGTRRITSFYSNLIWLHLFKLVWEIRFTLRVPSSSSSSSVLRHVSVVGIKWLFSKNTVFSQYCIKNVESAVGSDKRCECLKVPQTSRSDFNNQSFD